MADPYDPNDPTKKKPTDPVIGGEQSLPPETDPFASIGGGVKLASGGWVPQGHPLAQQQAAPSPAPAPAAAPAAPGQGANTPAAPTGQPPTTINDAFRQALLKGLNQDPNQIDQTAMQPQINAFNLAQQRSQERATNTLAEQAALEGTNTSGGFLSDKLGLEQQRAEAEGGFAAQLAGQQLQQNRDRIAQALQLALTYGNQQDALALQEKLAQMDAAIRQQALASQTALGQGDLALRGELGRGQLQLGQNQLGLNFAQLQAELNRQALLAALGG